MKEAKPKIVMTSNSFGSLYNFRYELICELARNYQVVLFTPMKEADYKKYEELKEKGCGLVETPFKRRVRRSTRLTRPTVSPAIK